MRTRESRWRRTTVLAVKREGRLALAADGQVTLGGTVMKADATKVRRLHDGKVLVGFAGSTADAFALLERLDGKLREHHGGLSRAVAELAKDWRTDRALRRLEAMLVVADAQHLLLVSGSGDVIAPSDGVVGIGSGGPYALAAARALLTHSALSAVQIARAALEIAGDICIYSNHNIVVEEIACTS